MKNDFPETYDLDVKQIDLIIKDLKLEENKNQEIEL